MPLLALPVLAPIDPVAKLRQEIDQAQRASNVKGISVVVVKDGKVVLMDGFGWADAAKRKRATADTVYAIGSSTKAFTGLLAAQAAQEGKLSLGDKPAKYLPGFRLKDPKASEAITLEDMLSHRSGLPRTDLAWYAGDFTRDELLQIAAQAEPTAPLRARWQYSNPMFVFAGMVEERVYGKPYAAILRERFFDPLGMAHTSATYADAKAEPALATGYKGDRALPFKNIDLAAPAGSVASSVRDMGRYLQMLLANGSFEGRQIFAKEAVEDTRKPRIEMPGGQYGLGWMLGEFRGAKTTFHGGNIDGFTAMVSLIPSEGLGVVALANADGASLPQQVSDLAFAALGPKAPPEAGPAKAEEAPPADLGLFRSATPPVEALFAREGKTTVLTANGQRLPLKLVGPKRYTYENVVFVTLGGKDKDGKRTTLLEQGPMKLTLLVAEPYRAPISAEALLAKAVEAQGGADAIRRHSRMVVRYRVRMPSEATEMYAVRYRRDARSVADYVHFYALGRRYAEMRTAVDGTLALDVSSFAAPDVKRGPEAADEVSQGDLLADLKPKRAYQSLEIVREDKVGAEPVYVLQKTLPGGKKTTEYVSQKDGRVLRREAGAGASRRREEYSDFRTVDGLTMPFRTDVTDASGVKSVEEILSVRFDERTPDWPFRAP